MTLFADRPIKNGPELQEASAWRDAVRTAFEQAPPGHRYPVSTTDVLEVRWGKPLDYSRQMSRSTYVKQLRVAALHGFIHGRWEGNRFLWWPA